MLAYGWVFHMGFFNFYLSMGLCFWAMPLAWNLSPRRARWRPLLLVLAYVAHALPVVWTSGLLAYSVMARRLSRQAPRVSDGERSCSRSSGSMSRLRRLMLTRWSPAAIRAEHRHRPGVGVRRQVLHRPGRTAGCLGAAVPGVGAAVAARARWWAASRSSCALSGRRRSSSCRGRCCCRASRMR